MPIVINSHLCIPDSDVRFSAARSAGPGGQHVNKVNSRVILEFDVKHTTVLSSYQKGRIAEMVGQRMNQDGVLRLQAQRHRTQSANRADLLEKFVKILQDALRPEKPRVATRVPYRVREKRLEEKKLRTRVKRVRQNPKNFDET
ncbi:alternative ribosome rescue aminoacyl-tRNA hydrolase ArfB [Candidatus Nitrospira allomarina]|jgi:ribosome-associated protein|uniref:Alternative ribosome rescue aminoacyl-tRNA hydrolase ArfB n=1 Tax=Candidatus Nitrospira allomarina TaxID=3020900 RepID=A0AA96JRN3_9BACT|nr:alternative ribosome rescue aminoacyl-tRNA hydrolase ArfB [Candidatus Nitrospira allomarina]WNM57687.1 alternative ribosome rescue aminoacyl-tRNA hydrolase ArfB [Candidatus Nitrospira allomarina]